MEVNRGGKIFYFEDVNPMQKPGCLTILTAEYATMETCLNDQNLVIIALEGKGTNHEFINMDRWLLYLDRLVNVNDSDHR